MILLEKKRKPGKKGGQTKGKKRGGGMLRPLLFKVAVVTLTLLLLALAILFWLQRSRAVARRAQPPVVAVRAQPERVPSRIPAASQGSTAVGVTKPSSDRSRAALVEEYQDSEPRRSARRTLVPKTVHPGHRSEVAIVMDDLGADLDVLRELLALDLAVTPAILPHLPHSRESARLAHAAGREVMLHLPMEPRDYPQVNPGPEPLLLSLGQEEIRRRMLGYLREVPEAVGANNHMGSRFTEDAAGMGTVLEILRQRRFYFVDSLTSSDSLGYAEAQRLGLPALERDVFLDNEQSVAAIRQQLQRLQQVARERGAAVGICHPHRETLLALRQELPALTAAGISVVPVSSLLSRGDAD